MAGDGGSDPPAVPEAPEVVRIHHVGVLVRDADAAAATYERGIGLEAVATEERPGVARVTFLRIGEALLELIQPLGAESPWAAALRERGEGAHHVALEVVDLRTAVAALASRGVRFEDPRPRRSAGDVLSVFLAPAAGEGTLIELVQQIRA